MAIQNETGGFFRLFNTPIQSKLVQIVGSNLAVATTDLYTVPAGKKCILGLVGLNRSFNPTLLTTTAKLQVKIGGVYYRMIADQALLTLTGGNPTISHPIVLDAGESVAVTVTDNPGMNTWITGAEIDANFSNIKTYRTLLANGDNTLFPCPAGKQLEMVSANSPRILNESGGTRAYSFYIIPNGGTKDSTTIAGTFSINNNTIGGGAGQFRLNPGDSVLLNTNSGAGSQFVWTTVYEV